VAEKPRPGTRNVLQGTKRDESVVQTAQLGDVHPELVRYIGPPCHLRTGITTPICTEGSHFCGVKVWVDFPNVPRRI